MTLKEAIERNRVKQARYRRAERILRAVRQRIFDYEDEGPVKYSKAQQVMSTCRRILAPLWDAQRRTKEAAQLEKTPSMFEPGLRG
jgi:hypothetical protein